MLIIFLNKVHFFYFCCIIHKDVGVKMYFAPSDTELLRALHSRNSKNIRNPLFFFKKWLLTHVFGGSQGQKSSCKQACIGFMTF